MRAVIVVVVVIATAVTSAAQTPGTPSVPDPTPFEEKDGGTAMILSVLGTLGGVVAYRASPSAGLAALVLGPSVGRWYNEELGVLGAGTRFGAALLALEELDTYDIECDEPSCFEIQRASKRRLYLYLTLMSAATLYDFVQASHGSDRYNLARRRLQIAPTVIGRDAPGLGVAFQW
jgi:hypothetical protein